MDKHLFIFHPSLNIVLRETILSDDQWKYRWTNLHQILTVLYEDMACRVYEELILLTRVPPPSRADVEMLLDYIAMKLREVMEQAGSNNVVNTFRSDQLYARMLVKKLNRSLQQARSNIRRAQSRGTRSAGAQLSRMLREDVKFYRILTASYSMVPVRAAATVVVNFHGLVLHVPSVSLEEFPGAEQCYVQLYQGCRVTHECSWCDVVVFVACGAYQLMKHSHVSHCSGTDVGKFSYI